LIQTAVGSGGGTGTPAEKRSAMDGDPTENLIKAFEATGPLVDAFGRVAQLAAAEKSHDAVHRAILQ
jgi:hypothetical protein